MKLILFIAIIGMAFADINESQHQDERPERCNLPAESGMCMALFYRFAFNQTSGGCEQFVYGGCGGNANKFFTQEACEVACGVSTTRIQRSCSGEPETGECKAYQRNWHFDSLTRSCLPFVYGGCGGNGNRYKTELECKQKCDGCPSNSHFNPCGSDCPLTCDNYLNPPDICNLMCRIGCECDEGYVLTRNGKCILPENCASQNCPVHSTFTCGTTCPLTCENYRSPPEICNEMCIFDCVCEDGYVLGENSTCVLPEDCPVKTQRQLPFSCQQDKEEGGCDLNFSRYFYNQTSEQCEEFAYKGCLGNDNNFQSLEDCEAVCRAAPQLPFACQQDKLDGSCDMNFSRHFYNSTSGQCQEFTYKGCLGNDNNFQSSEDCEAVCRVESNVV